MNILRRITALLFAVSLAVFSRAYGAEAISSIPSAATKSEKDLGQVLRRAIHKGNLAQARRLVDKNSRYWNSETLDLVVSLHRADLVRILLKHGVSPNARPSLKKFPHAFSAQKMASPLEEAASDGYADIVKILLKHGAKPGAALADAVANPKSSISMKDRMATVRLLLEHGANPNSKDGDLTALDWASANGYTQIVKTLLSRGADVNFTKGSPTNALKVATVNGHEDIVRILKSAQNVKNH